MDGMLVGDADDEARQVRELLAARKLPSVLSHLEVKAGNTWDGDPATYVFVRQAHNGKATKQEMDELDEFMSSVKAAAKSVSDIHPVFFRFLPAHPA